MNASDFYQNITNLTGQSVKRSKVIHLANTSMFFGVDIAVELDNGEVGMYKRASGFDDSFVVDPTAFEKEFTNYDTWKD